MRILVTGASRGIGRSIAQIFAQHAGKGAQVALLSRSMRKPVHSSLEGTLEDTARAIRVLGADALPLKVDLRDTEAAAEAARCAVQSFGGLDILINNASYLHLSSRPKPKQIRLAFEVNACATAAVMGQCADALRASNGACVTISPPLDTPYTTSAPLDAFSNDSFWKM